MNLSEKLTDLKKRLTDRRMYSFVIITVTLLGASALYQYKKAENYKNMIENQYQRSFAELLQDVNNIETSLAKSAVVTDPHTLVKLANEINNRAAFAAANLGQLPISHSNLENTSKFLSQTGDFTHSVALRHIDGGRLTEEERKSLANLSAYAKKLNTALTEMQYELSAKTLLFGDIKETGNAFAKTDRVMATEMENVEQQFQDYPSLIYDGPFSEHIQNTKPKLIQGVQEITPEQGVKRCEEIIRHKTDAEITFESENHGKVPSYTYKVVPDPKDKNRAISIELTKAGGALSWMLDTRFVPEQKIEIKEATAKAKAFLVSLGIDSMKESYYEINANVATINFAYIQQNIIIYPDLIKVKVALDNGEILGAECHGYISNHHIRTIPSSIIAEEDARSHLSPVVTVKDTGRLCFIPTEYATEVLCYEFKATLNDNQFLIYINAQNGNEEDVLMLLVSENGSLTI